MKSFVEFVLRAGYYLALQHQVDVLQASIAKEPPPKPTLRLLPPAGDV